MLKNITKQKYLKDLGYYKGEINGKLDKKTRQALMEFQKDIYPKGRKITRLYYKETDRALVTAHRIYRICKGKFKPSEFVCECGGKYCNGFPSYLSDELLENLMKVRKHYGKPITITSGMRCKGYNSTLQGSSSRSRHMQGLALDFYVKDIGDTEKGRIDIMNYWKKLKYSNYTYCYLPTKYKTAQQKNATYMGNAVHCDVDKA